MALTSGSKLGPFEIQSLLGAGGMGEVYRAKDTRLGRDVALKILPESFAREPDRLRRFDQEARAVAALNHPNILAIHDIGQHHGSPYIVSELLEGETLRERLRVVRMPVRKTVDYASQIARGLAAAHDRGIVHRDLKPENLFLTKDGRVKILDFGLAKLTHTETSAEETTRTIQSEAGSVVGTPGYMSPEQVRGKPADLRTDLFAFGAILYEMLSSKRAFQGDTAADIMTAILTKDLPELTQANPQVPPALDHIVRHCLEKNPEARFQSAHDLAFNLEMLSSPSGTATAPPIAAPARGRHRVLLSSVAIAALVLVVAGVFLLGRFTVSSPPMSPYKPLTFRRGTVSNARYATDGRSIVYSAAWDGAHPELFSVRADVPASVPLGIANADVVSVSRSGEMALVLNRHAPSVPNWINTTTQLLPLSLGTLARAPLNGGSPRPVLADVLDADWSRDGNDFVVTHLVGQHVRMEYPIGKVLYEMPGQGWLSDPRFLVQRRQDRFSGTSGLR
jgi:serine/threonine protein kinase